MIILLREKGHQWLQHKGCEQRTGTEGMRRVICTREVQRSARGQRGDSALTPKPMTVPSEVQSSRPGALELLIQLVGAGRALA